MTEENKNEIKDKNKDLLAELDELDGLDSESSSSTDGENPAPDQQELEQKQEESSTKSIDKKEEVDADGGDVTGKDKKETSDEKDNVTGDNKSETETETETDLEDKKSVEEVSREDKLLAEIERLSGLIDANKVTSISKTDENKKDEVIEKLAEDFIGDLDMDDVASNSTVLNKILLSVVKKAVELSGQSSSRQIENIIPLTVETHVKQYNSSKEAIDEFYKDNPDLSNVRKVVKACAAQVIEENPEMKWADVLNTAAGKTRETLGIVKDVEGAGGGKTGDLGEAAFASSSKHNRNIKKDNRTDQQKQIDEL